MGAIANDWLVPLSAEFKKPYYASLYKKVVEEYTTHVVYPPSDEIFTAFNLTPLSKVKVVTRSGTWFVFFCKAGRRNSAFSSQHL